MAKVIAKLEEMSSKQKQILSKEKICKRDTDELLRGQKRLGKLIKEKKHH